MATSRHTPTAARAWLAAAAQLSTPWPNISVITSISRPNAAIPESPQTVQSSARTLVRTPYRTAPAETTAASAPTATTA
ncbi:hypothetical protein [Streptomyces noursei]|uniref:hypothetical protein n=1 Tax=Streptomyces noursei TaxID=1971 RepID=UPI0037F6717D